MTVLVAAIVVLNVLTVVLVFAVARRISRQLSDFWSDVRHVDRERKRRRVS